jgi:hypothetical protein
MFSSPEECCADILENWDFLQGDYVCVELHRELGRDFWDWLPVNPEDSWHLRHLWGFAGSPAEHWRAPVLSVYLEPQEDWRRKPTVDELAMRLRPANG